MRGSPRLVWVAQVLRPAPEEHVLEVGCGHGVLVGLLAERTPAGRVVGVDRSHTMITSAARRNHAHLAAGRAQLVEGDFASVDLGQQRFGAVVAVNVRAFWTPPAVEWDVVRRVLEPDGRVLIAHSLLASGAEVSVTDAVVRAAGERGMRLVTVHRAPTSPVPSLALELRPASTLTRRSG
ncbi:methyltransferase domain-containing protein [Blastococcus haudaquaticus]|uniref:Methyltransferase domain-containing protein n=1 Tax=Blastococcus haudaquaticus TaxID=1938745 RepID=A0A286H659_9ACTN|nr:methyltransferase domain-containing protein [Blastococcus haudaquaticus]SOE03257.1 Methyltransferase domain-containing protein [Blastococcus haudaquaticus]